MLRCKDFKGIQVRTRLLGVFPGEGIGPEVTWSALHVLDALQALSPTFRVEVREAGPIGLEAMKLCGSPLSPSAIDFCRGIFAEGGAILAGPGGGRFVYDCRREFGLFYKLNPLIPSLVRFRSRRIKAEFLRDVDILIVRENTGGIYQGAWSADAGTDGMLLARQEFSYAKAQVLQVVEKASRLAFQRRRRLTLVTKPNGIPAISRLWQECTQVVTASFGLELRELEVDYAAFALIQDPQQFDVIVTSNLFGDILSDIGGILLGSRGLCFGASFSSNGAAIYQTNHGAAFDIAGADVANPVGHLHALAMLLERSFGLVNEARMIGHAIEDVWAQGWRTADLAKPGGKTVGTREITRLITEALRSHAHSLVRR